MKGRRESGGSSNKEQEAHAHAHTREEAHTPRAGARPPQCTASPAGCVVKTSAQINGGRRARVRRRVGFLVMMISVAAVPNPSAFESRRTKQAWLAAWACSFFSSLSFFFFQLFFSPGGYRVIIVRMHLQTGSLMQDLLAGLAAVRPWPAYPVRRWDGR